MTVKKYDYVIVGGGVVGVSMAYWLASSGVKNICLLEKDISVCTGSTARSAGGIRAQFSNAINVKLQLEALKFYEEFDKNFGAHAEFIQSGYLFMCTTEEMKKSFQYNARMQKELGLDVEELDSKGVKDLAPYVNADDVIYATYCKRDGYADPHGVTVGIWKACEKMGIDSHFQKEVVGVEHNGSLVESFVTKSGRYEGGVFINCAGAWSGELAKMAGSDVYVYPLKRMLFFTKELPDSLTTLRGIIPMTIDMETGFYMRKEGAGLLLGMDNDNEEAGFDTTVDWDWLYTLIEGGIKRVPELEQVEIHNAWAGLYDQSPDCSAVVGNVPGFENFYVVSGFSGHGFMQAPIVTRIMAEQLLGKTPSIDISSLSPERFKSGELVKESNII